MRFDEFPTYVRCSAAGVLAVGMAVSPSGALAQSAQGQADLDPIVVIGEGETEEEVPVASTTITRQEIEDSGATTMEEVARYVPNLLLTNQGSARFSVSTVRGIGNTIRDDYFNNPIGVYLDGVPLTAAEFSRRIGDVASIEVLRGPQGTLYGHAAFAGAISMTSAAPTGRLEAEAKATIGDNERYEGTLWASGPIAGTTASGRIFLDLATRAGFTEYLRWDETIDDLHSVTGSGSLRLQPSDNLTVTVSGSLERVDQGAYAYLPYYAFESRVLDIAPPNDEIRDSRAATITATYDFGASQLASITGLRSYDVESNQDLAYNAFIAMFGGGRTWADESGEQFSQEFRLTGSLNDSLAYTAGVFAQADEVDYDYLFWVPLFGAPSLSASSYDRREVAGFGEATWRAVGNLELTAGLRASYIRHELSNNAPFQGEADFTLLMPKAQLTYRFDPEKLVYVSATRGARPGGFNRLTANDRYDPEYLWSYEVGFKTVWADGRFSLNGAAFYIDWTDQQIRMLTQAGVVQTTNAGESHSKGIELEANWRPVDGLELVGFLGVTHAEYDALINRAGMNLAGNKMVNTPEMNAGVYAQYSWDIGTSGMTGKVRAEYLYTGTHYFDIENQLKQDGYGTVNFRAGVEKGNFSATAFVDNLFDEDYRIFGYNDFYGSFMQTSVAVAGPGRTFGVTLTARY